MANIKITDLNASTDPASTDVLAIVDVGADETKKITIADLLENAGSGTAAAPGISFDGDSNTGIYRPGADQLAISTAGTGRLFVDSSGNVGIGGSATHALTVTTSGTSGVKINTAEYGLLDVSDGTSTIRLQNLAGTSRLATATNHPLVFATNEVEHLRITASGQLSHIGNGSVGSPAVSFNGSAPSNSLVVDSTGKVGVGVTAPSTNLHIRKDHVGFTGIYLENRSGSVGSYSGISFGTNTSGTNQWFVTRENSSTANLDFALTLGSPLLSLTPTGNVGIGETSPAVALELGKPKATNQIRLNPSDGNVDLRINSAFGSTDLAAVSVVSNHPLAFHTSNTERARIDSSGTFRVKGAGTAGITDAVQLNGSAPSNSLVIDSSGKVGINSNPDGTGILAIKQKTDATNGGLVIFATDGSGAVISRLTDGGLTFRNGGDERLRITSSGKVGIGATDPSATLEIGTAATTGKSLRLWSGGNNYLELSTANNSNGEHKITAGNSASGTAQLLFETASGGTEFERMRIDSSGTFRVKGAGTAGTTDAVQLNGSAPANSLLLDASGRLLVGTTATAGGNATVQIRNDAASDNLTLFRASTISAAAAPALRVARSRGTAASPTEVSSGDALGYVVFQGYDGAAYKDSAYIYAEADGTWTDGGDTTDNPSRLVFSTTVDGEGTPTARMTIKNDGKVGVGTSSPQAQLQVLDAIKVSDSAQSQGSIILGDGGSTAFGVGIARWNGGANAAGAGGMGYFAQGSVNAGGHFFYTGDAVAGSQTERLRITSDAYVRLASGSGGIQFNGDTAAANALDDYEEGTWTPVFIGTSTAGTPTYNTNGQAGKYTKVGNQVTAWAYLDVTALGGAAGNINITGLPFPISNTGFGASGISTGHADGTLGNSVRAYHNTTFLELRNNNSVVTAATGLIYVSVTYTT